MKQPNIHQMISRIKQRKDADASDESNGSTEEGGKREYTDTRWLMQQPSNQGYCFLKSLISNRMKNYY